MPTYAQPPPGFSHVRNPIEFPARDNDRSLPGEGIRFNVANHLPSVGAPTPPMWRHLERQQYNHEENPRPECRRNSIRDPVYSSLRPPSTNVPQHGNGVRIDVKSDARYPEATMDNTNPVGWSLSDEIISPGEELHPDTDVQIVGQRGYGGEDTNIPHPSVLVRGRSLRSFQSNPPTTAERIELQQLRMTNHMERLSTTLSKKLSDRTIPAFKGNSDNVEQYSQWEAALLKHFYSSNIHNSAIRAWLAQNTFADAANV